MSIKDTPIKTVRRSITAPKTKTNIKRKIAWTSGGVLVLLVVFFGWGLWFASGQLLAPSFKGLTKDFAVCSPETEKYFGTNCGNLRTTKQFAFDEVSIPSTNGYDLGGWLVTAAANQHTPAKGAIMLVHAGGSDRREDTRYIDFYLQQGLDVLTFDMSCSGESPCKTGGLTYGQRESRDVLSAYLYLTKKYEKVYAMGSSVGAASILIALPQMPQLAGVIAENPYVSFDRLVKEAKESKSLPAWAVDSMLSLAMIRGKFDAQQNPKTSLELASKTPLFFIHSKADTNTPYAQTQELLNAYPGPKTAWFPEQGEHALVWNTNQAAYEAEVGHFLKTIQ